jgi:hypothetical protein
MLLRPPLSIEVAAAATIARRPAVSSSGSLEESRGRRLQSRSSNRSMERPDLVLLLEEALCMGCVDSSDIEDAAERGD